MSNRSLFPHLRRIRGYTLTELMVTVAVLAIVVAVAMPAYTSQMQKSRRADARNALLDIAAREERFLSVSNSYSAVPTDVGYGGGAWPAPPGGLPVFNNYYVVSVQVPDPNQPAVPTSFLITATPVNAQVSDTSCTSFTLNQLGAQGGGGTATPATCWGS
jgi:type IV pilus assembly protein PilE